MLRMLESLSIVTGTGGQFLRETGKTKRILTHASFMLSMFECLSIVTGKGGSIYERNW